MIVDAVPVYLSKASPQMWKSGMAGDCGMGQDCIDPDTGEPVACPPTQTVEPPPGSYQSSGGTIVPTPVTTPTPQPINVTVNNPGGTSVSSQTPWYDQLLATLGIQAGKTLLPAASTAIQASSLQPGQSLYTNPQTGVTSIVSSTGSLASSSTLTSLLPLLLVGGLFFVVIQATKR